MGIAGFSIKFKAGDTPLLSQIKARCEKISGKPVYMEVFRKETNQQSNNEKNIQSADALDKLLKQPDSSDFGIHSFKMGIKKLGSVECFLINEKFQFEFGLGGPFYFSQVLQKVLLELGGYYVDTFGERSEVPEDFLQTIENLKAYDTYGWWERLRIRYPLF